MNEISETEKVNNNIKIKKELHKEKSKQYINGENVYIYSVWKNKFSQITLRESTIYKMKNFISFIIGNIFFILFYVKPVNFKEFILSIDITLKNFLKVFIYLTPFSQPEFHTNYEYHYLIIISCIICMIFTVINIWLLTPSIIDTKNKKFFCFLLLMSLSLISFNIEYKISSLLIKISFMFKFFSFVSLVLITMVLHAIIFFIMFLILVLFKITTKRAGS